MKNRKKLMLFAILIFLLSASVSSAYAYWAGMVNAPDQKTDTININIGEGTVINTFLTLSNDLGTKLLVPAGQKNNSVNPDNCVEELIISYQLIITVPEGRSIAGYNHLANSRIAMGTVKLGGNTTYADYVKVSLCYQNGFVDTELTPDGTWYEGLDHSHQAYLNPTGQTIQPCYIKVTLTEPPTKAIYDQIFGKTIEIPLSFMIYFIDL